MSVRNTSDVFAVPLLFCVAVRLFCVLKSSYLRYIIALKTQEVFCFMKNKTHILYIVLLAVAVVMLVAATVLIIVGVVRDGARTVEDAVCEYEKGCMLYDSERIVKYSSDFRRDEIAEGKNMTASQLREFLDKDYSKATSPYLQGKLEFLYSGKKYYDKGTQRFDELLSEYGEHDDTAGIERFSEITVVVTYNGTKVLKVKACLVKINDRWFFFKNLL